MKKTLIFLLILAVAGGVFAQGLKLTGVLNTGLGVVTDTESEDFTLQAFGRDSERTLGQFRLNGEYTNEESTVGVKFRLQWRDGLQAVDLPFAFGYLKAFNNLLTLQGGIIDDGTFATSGAILGDDGGEGLGTQLIVSPIEGLNVGLGAYVGASTGDHLARYLENYPITTSTVSTYSGLDLLTAKYTFGATYTMADTFKVVASWRPKYWATTAWKYDQLIAGFKLLPIPALTAELEARIQKIDEYSDGGSFDIFATLGYKVNDQLSAGLNFGAYTRTDTTAAGVPRENDPVLLFWLWGQYAVTEKIIPRLDIDFSLNSYTASINANGASKWHYKYFDVDDYNKDHMGISFRPSVIFKIDSATSIEIGDLINVALDKNKVFGSGDKDSKIDNVFYIDYKWTF
jgi:hypothetical protein